MVCCIIFMLFYFLIIIQEKCKIRSGIEIIKHEDKIVGGRIKHDTDSTDNYCR